MSKASKRNIKTFFLFIIPIIFGMIIGKIAYVNQQEIIIRVLITISDNIVTILKFITPFLVFCLTTTAIFEIKGSKKEKIKNVINIFKIIFLTILPLTLIVTILSIIVVPSLTFELVISPTMWIEPLYKINITPIFSPFLGVILGIIAGMYLRQNCILTKIIYKIQKAIVMFFKYVITPIMPLWILSSFALTAYIGSSAKFFLTDFLLSILVLILQFSWLGIMYFITSKKIKKEFKKVILAGLKVFGVATSLSGNGGSVIMPFIIKEQQKLGMEKQKAQLVTATSFNMPGSLISNIVFLIGVISMTSLEITAFILIKLIVTIMLVTIIAPAIPGGTAGIVSSILPNYGFSSEQITLYNSLYYKQGISNSATNNAADIYITPFV